jgi:glycosyltransferase involved in cell wall biosynthesis
VNDLRAPSHYVLFADEWGGIGGTAGYLVMLAEGLRARGFAVTALCHDTPAMARVIAALRACGANVRPLPTASRTGPLGRLWRLARIIREARGGVLILLMGYFTRGGAIAAAGALAGASVIIRADLTPPEPPITWRDRWSLWLKDLFVHRIVVGADDNREAFARLIWRSKSKIEVIHTGIRLGRFSPEQRGLRAELGIADDAVVVGTVSRLDDRRKGMHDFVEMAGRVARAAPAVRFLVIGDGVLRPELERRAAALQADVLFAGWRDDVAAALASMDVFVMPSHFEGGPTSVLEAMAMARAVVASRVGMVPEVIDAERSGLIFAPGDVHAMTAAVLCLTRDAPLRIRLGAAARQKAIASLSVDRMVEAYVDLAARIASRGASLRRKRSVTTSSGRAANR